MREEVVIPGKTPPKNKMYVQKFKSDQTIWILFIGKCSIYSPIIELFFLIAKNLQPGSHLGNLNKDV